MGIFTKKPELETYTLTIKNNLTGEVEVIEQMLGILATILTPEKDEKGEPRYASMVWSISNDETETKSLLAANGITIHNFIQKRIEKREIKEPLNALGGLVNKRK